MRVIEVVCSVAECVEFQLGKQILRDFLKQPVNDHTAFYSTLAVQNKHNLGVLWYIERFLNDFITVSDVLSGIVEVPLD
jgi:hypothetical protein